MRPLVARRGSSAAQGTAAGGTSTADCLWLRDVGGGEIDQPTSSPGAQRQPRRHSAVSAHADTCAHAHRDDGERCHTKHACSRSSAELLTVSQVPAADGAGATKPAGRRARSVLRPPAAPLSATARLGRAPLALQARLGALWLSNPATALPLPHPRRRSTARRTLAISHSRAGTALLSQTQRRARSVARVRKTSSCLKSAPRLCRSLTENRADRPATFFEP